jgi:hypothetical protein
MSSNNANNNATEQTNQQGPPANAGIPKEVREKLQQTKRRDDGTIEVSGSSIDALSAQVDWQNLDPFQELILAALEELGLLDELARELYDGDGDGENPFRDGN